MLWINIRINAMELVLSLRSELPLLSHTKPYLDLFMKFYFDRKIEKRFESLELI